MKILKISLFGLCAFLALPLLAKTEILPTNESAQTKTEKVIIEIQPEGSTTPMRVLVDEGEMATFRWNDQPTLGVKAVNNKDGRYYLSFFSVYNNGQPQTALRSSQQTVALMASSHIPENKPKSFQQFHISKITVTPAPSKLKVQM